MSEQKTFTEIYVEYCTKQTDAPPIFHRFLSYLVLSSIINVKGYFQFGFKKVHPNLYLLIVAPSSAHRKSWSMAIASHIIRKVEGFNTFYIPEISSREAFVSELADPQRVPYGCGMIKIDELKGFLDRVKNKSYMEGFIQDLSSLYDGEPINRRKGIENPTRFYVDDPFLNIVAGCSNDWLYKSVESGDIAGGFFARFIWVVADGKIENPNPLPIISDKDLESTLIAKLYRISEFIGEIKFGNCENVFRRWYANFYQNHQGGLWDANYHRAALIIQKIAALNAVQRYEANHESLAGFGTTGIEVSDKDMAQAIALMEDTLESFKKMTIGVNKIDTWGKRVLGYIVKQKETTRSNIQNGIRGMTAKFLTDVLNTLVDAKTITIEGPRITATDTATKYLLG